ncbi:MAG TPA: SWIM zinc finger family protein [Xanthobacteraceae bacterium]
MGDFGFGWGDYVSVAEKQRRAKKELAKLKKQGRSVAPVTIEGRKIARNFWGKSWCTNLERYSDFASRLPRGRSYVCNGFVVDLQIARGKIAAKVSGSELYDVAISIAPVAAKRWRAICRDCSGTIDSLVELLQGRLAKGVMDRVCRERDGLFPSPDEIELSCSCPDWAGMCKHVAATLYGVGARLDEAPRLLFVLRGVDEGELLAGAGQDSMLSKSAPDASAVLDSGDVAALFGIDMAEGATPEISAPAVTKSSRRTRAANEGEAPAATRSSAASREEPPTRRQAGSARNAKARIGKKPGHGRAKRSGRRPPG